MAEIKGCFKAFDPKRTGRLSLGKAKKVFKTFDAPVTHDELVKMSNLSLESGGDDVDFPTVLSYVALSLSRIDRIHRQEWVWPDQGLPPRQEQQDRHDEGQPQALPTQGQDHDQQAEVQEGPQQGRAQESRRDRQDAEALANAKGHQGRRRALHRIRNPDPLPYRRFRPYQAEDLLKAIDLQDDLGILAARLRNNGEMRTKFFRIHSKIFGVKGR